MKSEEYVNLKKGKSMIEMLNKVITFLFEGVTVLESIKVMIAVR